MSLGPILTGLGINIGALFIEAGIKKALPEITKLINDPEVRKVIKSSKLDKLLTESVIKTAKRVKK